MRKVAHGTANAPVGEDGLPSASLRSALRAPRSAILLLGPTGSGKTPLGEALERRGLWGRPCAHFDFGAQLRGVAAAGCPPPWLTDSDLATIREALATGRLLTDGEFPIALAILKGFIARTHAAANALFVLNGLPRHRGQAAGLEPVVRVEAVVYLECPPSVVRERIRLDAGGDRKGRADDSAAEVANKLRIFNEETAPLLDHYRAMGVGIEKVTVGVGTTAAALCAQLASRPRRRCPNH